MIRGKYRILGKIGEGGMGTVYKALHVHFKELRALKVMAPQLIHDKALVKRFGREAVLARKLRHRNAVRVEDFDETEDGQPFIVMEFIEGRSLKNLMQSEGPLPVARVCSIIKQAAAALDAAHRLGLVHRDIKPDNIILVASDNEEVAKVLDFGIAKIKDRLGATAGLSLTQSGMVIGTPPYMSPEQAKGAGGDELDGRSDLYSLGVVMYQMLTGELPLTADTPLNMLLAQIQTPPTPIHNVRPGLDIPGPVAALVMKCLAKERERRPQTGNELIEQLERWEKGSEAAQLGPTPPQWTDPSSWPRTVPQVAERGSKRAESESSLSEAGATVSPEPPGARSRPKSVPSPAAPEPRASRDGVLKPSHESGADVNASASRSSPHPSSHWLSILAIALVLVFGLGSWYFFHSLSSAGQNGIVKEGNEKPPSAGELPVTQPGPIQGVEAPDRSHGSYKSPAASTSPQAPSNQAQSGQAPSVVSRSGPVPTEAEKAIRSKKINAARTLGDLYYENGQYDNAIKEYLLGLEIDPSNKPLRKRVELARRAKAVERQSHN